MTLPLTVESWASFYPLCLSFLLCKIGIIIPHELVVQNEKDNAWKVSGRAFGTLINGPTCCYHYNEYNNTIIINFGKIIIFPKIILLRELFIHLCYRNGTISYWMVFFLVPKTTSIHYYTPDHSSCSDFVRVMQKNLEIYHRAWYIVVL